MKITITIPRRPGPERRAVVDALLKLPITEVRFDPWAEMVTAVEMMSAGVSPRLMIEEKLLPQKTLMRRPLRRSKSAYQKSPSVPCYGAVTAEQAQDSGLTTHD